MQKEDIEKEPHLRFAVLATDVVLFSIKNDELFVRLIPVDRPPFFPKGSKGFPGGLIDPSETAEDAARRILKDKGLIRPDKAYLEQLYTFSALGRDTRGRVVAVSYIALTPWEELLESEKHDHKAVWWTKVSEISGLAYDHDEMLAMAVERLRSKIKYTTLICKLLPKEFTHGELERSYVAILNESIDKRKL